MVADDQQRVRALLNALDAQVQLPAPDLDCIRELLRELEPLDMPHHTWESEFFFPKVRQRCPALSPVLERLDVEHQKMEAFYTLLASELHARTVHASAHADGLIPQLESFARIALGHLEIEERYILPVAADFLSPADWIEIDRATSPPRK